MAKQGYTRWRGRATVDALVSICEILGFALTSYGLLRQSFVEIAAPATFPLTLPASFGPANWFQAWLVWLGKVIGLLPEIGALSNVDMRANAAMAVLGVSLIGIALIINVTRRFTSRSG